MIENTLDYGENPVYWLVLARERIQLLDAAYVHSIHTNNRVITYWS